MYFTQFPEAKTLAPEELSPHTFPRVFGALAAPAMIDDLLPIAEEWKPNPSSMK
jgi:hypothetical protein